MSDKIYKIRFTTVLKVSTEDDTSDTAESQVAITTSFLVKAKEWDRMSDSDKNDYCLEKFLDLNIVSWTPTVMKHN